MNAQYNRDGFAIVPGFLTGSRLSELQARLDDYIRSMVPTLPPECAFYQDRARPETLKQLQFLERDPWFAAYCEDPAWRGLAETLIGEEAHCQSPEWFNKPPGVEHPTPPHQDNYYFNLTPPHVLTIWLALDPVDEENGCLRYVAGSHREGFRTHARSNVLGFSQGITDYSASDEAREVLIRLQPGDAAVHHGMTIHRADPNRSQTRSRRSFAMVFKGVSCRRDERGYARYLDALKTQHNDLGVTA